MEGECAICSSHHKLSFEHVPPQAAFNDKPIYIKNFTHFDESSKYFGKQMRSNRGFGSFTLCESCNKNTGSWYAKDFAKFAEQGMDILNATSLSYVRGTYVIKPLNVIKQIATMFMSADKSGHLRSKGSLVNFILNKESNQFPNDLRIYIYSNASPFKRMIGYSVIYDPILGVQKWSEINFQPFGYFLTEESKPGNENMVDITRWAAIPYDKVLKVDMTTPYLKVSTMIIGTYG
jgi:hypothetical protein